jgi:hypothetical protein
LTFITLVIAPLVIFLFFLIFRMNYAPQFRPQAYYRRKVGGAPVAGQYEALGPRPRAAPPGAEGEGAPGHRRRRRAAWRLEGGRADRDGDPSGPQALL